MAHSLLAEDEAEALKEAEGITEIIKLDPSRMDGVFAPANGAPFLLIKSIASDTGGAAMTATATETENATTEEAAAATGTETTAKGTPASGSAPEEPVVKDSTDGDDGEEDEGAEGETDDDGDAEADAGAAKAADEPAPVTKAQMRAARGAYEDARRDYEATEPTTKGALDPTDYLKARADWTKWREAGKSEGLDGTQDGMKRWVAKHLGETGPVEKGDLTTEQRNNLSGSDFAYIDSKGDRHLPVHDEGHVRSALGRFNQQHFESPEKKKSAARKILSRAKSAGIDVDSDAAVAEAAKTVVKAAELDGGDGGQASKAAEPAVAEETTALVEEAPLDPQTAIQKAMAAGLISREVAEGLLAKVGRPLPATTQPAGAHREPDGNTSVEQLEHDAGMHTDADGAADRIPAPVAEAGTIPSPNANTDVMAERVGKQAPYSVQRMHDALCPAYDDSDVLAAYPALKSVMDAVDSGWFASEAAAKQAAGKAKKAAALTGLAEAATGLRAADPAALADARASLRKAFTDAYPDVHIRPGSVAPGSFHRPWITAGHEANSPAVTGTQAAAPAPPAAHVPEPQQFQRGNLTAGHESPSPGDHGPNNPRPPGSSGNDYYSASEQMMARAAQQSIHDHIQATFAGCCPMAPTRHALPTGLGMGATNVPEKKMPMSMGGIPTVGKSEDVPEPDARLVAELAAALAQIAKTAGPDDGPASQDGKPFGGHQAAPFGKPKKKKGAKKEALVAALKEAAEAGAAAALAAMKDTSDGTAVQALVAGEIQAIGDRYDSQLSALTKQVEELGSQPDPAQAPVRGQMSRPEPAAAPVEKRSLIDEHREAQVAKAAAERAQFVDYIRMQAQSPDPKVRSRAEDLLRSIPA